jgi:antitoxin (DNA-binding transcriptional repressor) of toxin-antitoxin stability system
VSQVQTGEEIIIARSGVPVARLVRIEPPSRERQPGTAVGKIHISSDFDAPLPPEVLDEFR